MNIYELHALVDDGDYEELKNFLESEENDGIGIDEPLPEIPSFTPLLSAISKEHVDVTKLLLEHGADHNYAPGNDLSPIRSLLAHSSYASLDNADDCCEIFELLLMHEVRLIKERHIQIKKEDVQMYRTDEVGLNAYKSLYLYSPCAFKSRLISIFEAIQAEHPEIYAPEAHDKCTAKQTGVHFRGSANAVVSPAIPSVQIHPARTGEGSQNQHSEIPPSSSPPRMLFNSFTNFFTHLFKPSDPVGASNQSTEPLLGTRDTPAAKVKVR